ncbi:CPBP family intramembrane glutamic endopeptidase [Rossellomorea vietnamensis]|uniref:CPBP family intramembrane glutamic endopeptidase n=1 Tax=Rossellomorea vietnamensis TaxID=218284 RepID=UPI00350E3FD5
MPLKSTFELLTSTSRKYFLATPGQIALFIIGTGILAPIWEEMFFKGLLLRKLMEKTNSFIALFVVIFIFPVVHISGLYDNFTKDLFMIFLAGTLTSLLYLKTKSVFPSIILHVIWNLFFIFYWNYI